MSHADVSQANTGPRDERVDALDTVPGQESAFDREITHGVRTYLIGLALAVLLTALSFWLPTTQLVWGPGIPVALIVFAIAQMGVHLVFFLHITTAPDNTNNVLALAFGVLIVVLVIGGSIWIMSNMSYNMMPAADAPMQMQQM
jgi:cytochrome o ubiquinol oxidase operon protein cyoD